jgi:hypothetical protein
MDIWNQSVSNDDITKLFVIWVEDKKLIREVANLLPLEGGLASVKENEF